VKFGLKLWSTDAGLMDEAAALVRRGIFGYVELTPVPGTDISRFLPYDIPYVIHVPAEAHGVNIADPAKAGPSRACIRECAAWADRLRAAHLILHPGFGDADVARQFLEGLSDGRVLLENMPKIGIGGEPMIGFDPARMRSLAGGRFGFCLDVNHAIKAAVSLRRDYRPFLDRFLRLGPTVVHLSDGSLDTGRDQHLHIGSGDYDFRFIMERLRRRDLPCVTLETPRSRAGLGEAVEDLEKLLLLGGADERESAHRCPRASHNCPIDGTDLNHKQARSSLENYIIMKK
jgi:deoxyribonuclease-4